MTLACRPEGRDGSHVRREKGLPAEGTAGANASRKGGLWPDTLRAEGEKMGLERDHSVLRFDSEMVGTHEMVLSRGDT